MDGDLEKKYLTLHVVTAIIYRVEVICVNCDVPRLPVQDDVCQLLLYVQKFVY